jgi:hypothetical protein
MPLGSRKSSRTSLQLQQQLQLLLATRVTLQQLRLVALVVQLVMPMPLLLVQVAVDSVEWGWVAVKGSSVDPGTSRQCHLHGLHSHHLHLLPNRRHLLSLQAVHNSISSSMDGPSRDNSSSCSSSSSVKVIRVGPGVRRGFMDLWNLRALWTDAGLAVVLLLAQKLLLRVM